MTTGTIAEDKHEHQVVEMPRSGLKHPKSAVRSHP